MYVWADGVYLQARMEPQAECMLVLIGATPEGKRELPGFQVGVRESTQSWRERLVDLKARGLSVAPEMAVATFAEKYGAKYDKAALCLTRDRDALRTFHDFPAEHWEHLRTSNPIESVFATVRHRAVRTKGALSQDTARLMVFKLVMAAAETWRRLKGENPLPKVVQGVTFRNGGEVTNTPAQHAV